MIFVSFFVRLLLIALIPASLIWTGFGANYEDVVRAREQYALEQMDKKGDIVVVAIKEPWAESYINGIRMAISEINARPNKLLGRNVRLMLEEGYENYDKDRSTIIKIASNPQVTAVLGHHKTEVGIPASVIYEQAQVIFMPPLATGKDVTTHNFRFTFRMIPHNGVMARQLASVAKLLGYKNVALLYSFGYSRRELAFLFEDAAVELNIHFVARRSFNAEHLDYRDLISQFTKMPLDMVFLSTDTKSGARMIGQLREMGINVPIMGGSSLNLGNLKDMVGEAGNGTIVPAFYRPRDSASHETFRTTYKAAYGKTPDQNAAQGYDSMNLLAHGIETGKSTHPLKIASTLHHTPFWEGITGIHSFDNRGDVVGKKYFFQVLQDSQWKWLPVVHNPYLLWQFDRLNSARDHNEANPKNGFVRAFVTVRSESDLRVLQLNFLHAIFNFKNLGVIYAEDDDGGEDLKKLAKVKQLAKDARFKVDSCGIKQQGVTPDDLEKQLLRCMGKLALQSDMLNISGLNSIDKASLQKVLAPLEEYKVPLISLEGDVDLGDLTTVRLRKFSSIFNTHSDSFINLFNGILRNQRVHDFSEKVQNLPILDLNMEALERYNMLRSTNLVQLCPDFLIKPEQPRLMLTAPKSFGATQLMKTSHPGSH